MTDPATFRIDASVDRLKDVRRFVRETAPGRGDAEPSDDLTLLVVERRPA